MNHYYQKIRGWSHEGRGFLDGYKRWVAGASGEEASIAVEVGCWMGRSLAFLCVEAINSKKPIHVFGVDTFQGSLNEAAHVNHPSIINGTLEQEFHANMEPIARWEERSDVNLLFVHPMPSVEAAKMFADDSVSLLMIDGDHSYEAVKADLEAWLPKLKKGATLIFDDANWDGVKRNVEEQFPHANLLGEGKSKYYEVIV